MPRKTAFKGGTMSETSKSAGGAANAMSWLDDVRQLVEKYRLPGVDVAALAEWQRKDAEALAEANRQAAEGLQTLIARRNEVLQETLAEWQAAVKDVAGPEALAKQADAAKTQVEKAVANFQELAQLEAEARTNAWKVVQDRMQDNLDTLRKLLQPK
jgi:phasin family protein